MRYHLATLLAAACLTFASNCAHAQSSKIPVQVTHAGRDNVGSRLAFELRETIRSSNSMRYVLEAEADPRIVVHMVTLDLSASNSGSGTAAAVAVVYDGKFVDGSGTLLTVLVQTCGNQRTADCARDLAADIDSAIERFRKNWPNLSRLLR